MPFFSNSSGVNINGGSFYEIGGDMHLSRDAGIHILHRAVALEAMHDSADSYPQLRCHPETREEMLDKLWNWATKSVWDSRQWPWESLKTIDALPIVWLYGPAGAGKSAIMRTFSERLADAGCLGGSFFFKRGHITRGNEQKLFATLSYQLALNNRPLKGFISKIVEDSPDLVAKSMNVQLQKLVMDPCGSLDSSQLPIIVIDGLDECEGRQAQQEILRLIANAIRQHSPPLRLLIASRPEPHIREIFEAPFFEGLRHMCNVEQSKEDVRKYLRDEFARIHQEHHQTMAGISSPWPSQEVIQYLANKSSGYFIYASTVIKFIDDRNFRPTEQLEAIQNASNLESPFGALDQLYTQILLTVSTRYHHGLLRILAALDFLTLNYTLVELNSFWSSNQEMFSSFCGTSILFCMFHKTAETPSMRTMPHFETSSMILHAQASFLLVVFNTEWSWESLCLKHSLTPMTTLRSTMLNQCLMLQVCTTQPAKFRLCQK
ncbi:hypothetical protein C8J57DRAFT_454965 [Mycena rebaudengoi]|nr:hypothetical protein C8J57DRAFT_454965 [Mycena rebaudengoi]